MKANELRIGNWVYIPQAKTNEQIGVIEENGRFLTKGYKTSYSSIECLRPIPLTEEWLLRFGFRKKASFSDHTIHIDMTNILCLDNDNNESEFSAVSIYDVDEGVWIYLESIQYVHQLQNLYFVLSREELKLKDDENN
jgi:hypothetical protein